MENLNNPRKEKEKGSGFTNIQKVIDANKGNRLGSAVSSNLTEMGQKTQQAVNNAVDRFSQQMEQGALGEKQKQERENVLNKVEQGQAIDDQDIQSFSRFRQGQYTGPRGIENKEQLLEQADRGQAIAGSVGTQQGRQGLLQQFAASPKYTRGALRTDALLLGQEAPKLQEAATGLRSVSRNVQTAARSAEEQAKQAELKTQEFGRETEKILEDRYNQTMNPVEQAQKEALDKYTRQQTKFGELQNEITASQKHANAFRSDPITDDKRKEILDKYASEIGLDPKLREELKQRYDALRQTGLSGAEAGRALIDSMKLNQQDLGKLQQLGTFMDQGTANKIAALQRLSGKEVQDFGEIGGYKEGYTTSDTSLLKQFADIRAQGKSEFSQSVRMSEIYNNSKNIRKNALDGNQENRDFFISMNPKLGTLYAELEKLKSDYKNLPKTSGYLVGSRGYNKQMEEYAELINNYVEYIDKIQGEVIDSLPGRIKALNESSMKKLKMSTLQDFKDNYNSGPKIKY
jgi:hypothetical protein